MRVSLPPSDKILRTLQPGWNNPKALKNILQNFAKSQN
jgi:hypothetical protein